MILTVWDCTWSRGDRGEKKKNQLVWSSTNLHKLCTKCMLANLCVAAISSGDKLDASVHETVEMNEQMSE